jgi:hypothetical protein
MSRNDKLWNQLAASFSDAEDGTRNSAARNSGAAGQPKAKENRGFDPYNTSGNFDRKKNWNRVGKR